STLASPVTTIGPPGGSGRAANAGKSRSTRAWTLVPTTRRGAQAALRRGARPLRDQSKAARNLLSPDLAPGPLRPETSGFSRVFLGDSPNRLAGYDFRLLRPRANARPGRGGKSPSCN